MTRKMAPSLGTEVKALRIALIVLLFLYGLVSASALIFLVRVFPAFLARTPEALTTHSPFVTLFRSHIRISFERVLIGLVYFFIAYCIFKLISLISHGDPFNPASPRIIRRIGWAVLSLAGINAVVQAFAEFIAPNVNVPEIIIRILYHGLSTLLLGFGFLVIAKVIEIGVRLQQDQNLTV